MRKILYIGWCMPYDSVPHAGGQVFNYYIKEMSRDAEVKLITIALPGEKEKATIEKYGVDARYIEFKDVSMSSMLKSVNSRFNPWHKYGNLVLQYKADLFVNEIKELKKTGFVPDVVVLQWTQTVLMVKEIKKIYPDPKYIAVEEDVTFQRLRREYENAIGILYPGYKRFIYSNEKKRELSALEIFDSVYVNNRKDCKILTDNGFNEKKLKVLVPYFHFYNVDREKSRRNRDILFFGNMGRSENYYAVKTFIEKVMPEINIPGTRFVIVGASSDRLKKYESERIVVTGFVQDVSEYFASSAVFVAPLKYGAGIKIKVLEAMSSGIPVITTDVGIEGIPAKNGEDVILYETNNELVSILNKILKDETYCRFIGENGKRNIIKNFNYDESVKEYKNHLLTI